MQRIPNVEELQSTLTLELMEFENGVALMLNSQSRTNMGTNVIATEMLFRGYFKTNQSVFCRLSYLKSHLVGLLTQHIHRTTQNMFHILPPLGNLRGLFLIKYLKEGV